MQAINKKLQLFCIPYAGTSASFYYNWNKKLLEDIEVVPVELAGRGSRMRDPFYTDFDSAVNDIFQQIVPAIQGKYIIFGHCMGSILAYELAVKLQQSGIAYPDHIIFSGQAPPDNRNGLVLLSEADDQTLIKELMKLGADVDVHFMEIDIADFFLPILKADCKIFDKYELWHRKKVTCDISVFFGDQDKHNNKEAMLKWEEFTEGRCSLYGFHGDHFFIDYSSNDVIDTINRMVLDILHSTPE